MTRIRQQAFPLLKNRAANGTGVALDVRDYSNIGLTVYTSGSTTATIKFAVSNSTVAPNFAIAPSVTNIYDFVSICPIGSQLVADRISGATGLVLAGTDLIKMYETLSNNSSNNINWICPIVSGWSAGSITVELTGTLDVTH